MSDEHKNDLPEDAISLAAEDPPVKPRTDNHLKQGKAWDFYQTLNGKWQMWWDDFSTTLNKDGRLKYKTVTQFIRYKTKVEWQQDVIAEMIGPRPDGKTLRVPWLGDWAERRKMCFNNFEDPRKLKAIKLAWDTKLSATEAARSLVPLTTRHIARWDRLADKIDEAFGGQILSPNEPPDSPNNQKRAEFYIKMQKQVLEVESGLWQEYFRCHGLNPSMPETWLMMRSLDASKALPDGKGEVIEGQLADVDGHQMSSVALPEGTTIDDLLLAKMLRKKASMYNMKLPEELDGLVPATTAEDVAAAKKKVH